MSDIQQQAEAIGISIENAKNSIEVSDGIKRLRKNRDFKKIVKEGYLEKEALRLTHLLDQPGFDRDEVLRDLEAIAKFRGFMDRLEDTGDQKRAALDEYRAEQEELNAELAEQEEG